MESRQQYFFLVSMHYNEQPHVRKKVFSEQCYYRAIVCELMLLVKDISTKIESRIFML